MTLEGPTPWHAKGTAKLKLFWFLTVKVSFEKTFGETRNVSFPDVRVLDRLVQALEHPQNWRADPPQGRHQLVSFRAIDLSQKEVPLNLRIDRLGNQRPLDGRHFSITTVDTGAGPVPSTFALEQFAPAQYFDMSDAAKLTSTSFAEYDAGVRFADSENVHADYAVKREVDCELHYVDGQRELEPPIRHFPLDGEAFAKWTLGGAVAASPLSHAIRGKSALAPETVSVGQEGYAVVSTDELRLVDGSSVVPNEAQANDLMKRLLETHPYRRDQIQVVPAYEVATS
jgi:hypothetical protein